MESDGHIKKGAAVKSSTSIQAFFPSSAFVDEINPLKAKVRRAEVKVTATVSPWHLLRAQCPIIEN